MDNENVKRLIGSRIAIARNGEEIRLLVNLLHCSADFILGLSDTITIPEQ